MADPLPTLDVTFAELAEVHVAAIRSIVAAEDVPEFMADALGMVAEALGGAGIAPVGPPFARYFSMGAEGLEIAAGFPVAGAFHTAGVVGPAVLPAGPAVVATFRGSFDGIEAAWTGLRRAIVEAGRVPGDDPWEVYVVGPGSGVDEADWRTELVWPLAPPAEGGLT